MEDTNSSQGFHIITTTDDAFAGLTAELVQELRQEYEKKPILLFGLSEEVYRYDFITYDRPRKHVHLPHVNASRLMKTVQEAEVTYMPIQVPPY